jgi:hypothetical protein
MIANNSIPIIFKSYPILSTIDSINPLVLSIVPINNESSQLWPNKRLKTDPPPIFPAMAISITSTDAIGSSGCKQKSKCTGTMANRYCFKYLLLDGLDPTTWANIGGTRNLRKKAKWCPWQTVQEKCRLKFRQSVPAFQFATQSCRRRMKQL